MSETRNLKFSKLPSKKLSNLNALLLAIKQAEKRAFPTNEAFDFDGELKKTTTVLHCAYWATAEEPKLAGYIVHMRSKRITRIHKVCVVEAHRRRGVGRWMMEHVLGELQRGSAGVVDLWVDPKRGAARQLYRSCGFGEREAVEDYYPPGRDAIRMELDLG